MAYETRINRIAREIAFDEAWPETEEDAPALGEGEEAEPSRCDQHEPKPFIRPPFYSGSFNSGRKPRERSPLQECVYRLCGALVHFASVFAIVAAATLLFVAIVELWKLFELVDRYDWDFGLASHFIGEHWRRAAALLEFAKAFIAVFGSLGGIASAIAVLVTGETAMPDLIRGYQKMACLLRTRS